ncbi:MAG TPA: Holliday junction resolvase RuvX [Acidimicrobiia bacterium]|nr:Holliday junction resolvase RuvX [Acidimicrobiia bacterium]
MTAAGRALGVDLGERRIGLALSDPQRIVASPHDVLVRSGDRGNDARRVVEIARAEGVTTIVVGLPLSLSGREGPAARVARADIDELRGLAAPDIDVEVQDERLTTVTAERALREAKLPRARQRDVVDKVAAAVMLQAWLERHA